MLTLSVGSTDTVSSIVALQGRFNSPWEFGLDENLDFNSIYNISILPTVFLFNEDGAIVKRWEGITPPESILDEIGAYNSTMGNKIDEYIGIDSNRSPSDLMELILESPIIWGIIISIAISIVYFRFIHNKKFPKILS